MDLSYGHEYDTFREEVKSFIQAHQHKQPGPGDGLKSPALREWQRLLIENGYHSRTISSEYGGFGAEPDIARPNERTATVLPRLTRAGVLPAHEFAAGHF